MNADRDHRADKEHRIAIMYHYLPSCLGYGEYLQRGLEKIHQVTHFLPGEETEGYDHYLYVDDGPTAYMEPKYRPATYVAMDMVVMPFWYLDPVEHYFERCQNFDNVLVTSTASLDYCQDRGMKAKMIGFACDPELHHPVEAVREWDWIALWHNCGDRIEVSNKAMERFPGGRVSWRSGEEYCQLISASKCALNWLRGNIVNMRVFEVMAMGTPLITTRHEDMNYYGFIEGEHYLGYTGIDEMLAQIEYANTHPHNAMRMADRARDFVLSRHTYYHRALKVFA